MEHVHPALYDDFKPSLLSRILEPLWKVVLVVLIPLRLVTFFILIYLSTLLDKVLNFGTDQSKPLPKWRYYLWRFQKGLFYRLALFLSGYVVVVRGKQLPDAQVMVLNHQSLVDIGVGYFSGSESSVAKAGLAKNFIFGPSLRITRSILARQSTGYQQLCKRVKQIPPYPVIGVFPSGTTTCQGRVTRFRSGAFGVGARVQLCGIEYRTRRRIFYTAGSALSCVLTSMSCPLCIVKLIFDDRVLQIEGSETPQEFADRAGRRLAQLIHGAYQPYTYKDVLWFGGAEQFRDQLSQEYINKQLWRGNWDQWEKRCKKLRLDPAVSHTREKIEALEAKKAKNE